MNTQNNPHTAEWGVGGAAVAGQCALRRGTQTLHRTPGADKQLCDLHHRPPARAVHSKNGIMFCLVKCMGLCFDFEAHRPWTVSELMTSMGMPISEAHQALTSVSCVFSHGVGHTPACRTLNTASEQAGNAMHVAAIGASLMYCLLAFPNLGTRRVASPSAPPVLAQLVVAPLASLEISAFASAVARIKRRRLDAEVL
jgi:hypothetical protein